MTSLDTDVNMVPAGEGSSGAGPSNTSPTPLPPQSSKKAKRFEIKKWNAVALWAWGITISLDSLSTSILCRTQIITSICECEFVLIFYNYLRPIALILNVQILLSIIVLFAETISWISVSLFYCLYYFNFFSVQFVCLVLVIL